MTVVAETDRLPAGPLLAAVDQARAARGIPLRALPSWQVRAVTRAKAEATVTPYTVGRLCKALGRDPRALYGDDLPEIPEGPPSPPQSSPRDKLPAGPLLDAIDAHCATRGVTRTQALGDPGRRCRWRVEADGAVSPRVARRLCDLIGADPQGLYGDAWREPPPRRHEPASTSGVRLDAAPLLEAIDRRMQQVIAGLVPLVDEVTARAEATLEVFCGDRSRATAYRRARQRGWVHLAVAEQFCDAFGWHPRMLWGDTYDQAAFTGCPDDYDPWEGVAA